MALTQTDVDRIEQVFRETLSDIPEHKFDEWLANWTPNARLMPPDAPDVTGHEQLREWMRDWPEIKRFDIIDTELDGSGDLAVLICHFDRVLAGSGGEDIRQHGRQVLKFHRQPDGDWKIAAAIFNAYVPKQ